MATTGKALGNNLKFQKRLATAILGCGHTKTWLDPTKLGTIAKARNREHVRMLIGAGFIKKKVKPFKEPMPMFDKIKRRTKLRLARQIFEEEGLEIAGIL